MDESQNMDETARGLLAIRSKNLKQVRQQNYLYNASSGSHTNLQGFISGSGEVDDNRSH